MAAERLVRGQWLRDEGDLVRVRARVRVLVTLTLTLTLLVATRKATSSLIGVSAVSSTTHRVSETCVNAVDGTIVWPGTKQQNDMPSCVALAGACLGASRSRANRRF